ncbi:hypothetical protein ACIQ1D_00570 [Lysinibacillus xylanilyticus]|uniref:hypothetical protein n=1 Tax=Lysinibacillus xylanilyticus TaxID=582475 RepID=UPI0038131CF6
MKVKKISLVLVLILASFITNDVVVHADDHEHEDKKHEKYKEYYKDDDDDDEKYDDDEEGETYYFQDAVSEKGTWNIWTRTVAADKEVLPFTSSQKVTLKVEGTNKELSCARKSSSAGFRSKSNLL